MRTLGVTLGLAQRATAAGARLFELLDRAPRITAPQGARPLPTGAGRVELRDVCFAYEGARAPALRNVSLTVEGGTTLALVGATGSGKSTLVALVPRLYDATAGARARRRRRCARARPARPARRDRRRLRGPVPVLRHVAREHRLRAAGRDARGGRRGRAARPGPRVHRGAAGGLRHARRRARADPVRRPAPAHRARPGAAGRPAHPDPRRRHPRSTPPPSARSSRPCARSWPGGRPSSSPTGSRRSRWPTTSSSWRTGASLARGSHEELLERSALFREIVEKGLPDQVFLTRKPLGARWRDYDHASCPTAPATPEPGSAR